MARLQDERLLKAGNCLCYPAELVLAYSIFVSELTLFRTLSEVR